MTQNSPFQGEAQAEAVAGEEFVGEELVGVERAPGGVESPSAAHVGFELTVVLGVVLVTMFFSGMIVRFFTRTRSPEGTSTSEAHATAPQATDEGSAREGALDTGNVVGKCENILVVLLVLADAMTGLALIFTAKTFVRQKNIQENPRYYLVGTMVNVTFSIVMGFLARAVLVWCRGKGQLFL